MLTPEYLQKLPLELIEYYMELEDLILKDVVRRLNNLGNLQGTATRQLEVLLEMDYSIRDIEKEIAKRTKKSQKMISKLVEDAGLDDYANDVKLYKVGGKQLVNINANQAVLNMIDAAKKIASGDLNNITKTLGLNGHTLQNYYQKTLSQAVIGVRSGAFSSQEIIRKTINELGNKGLQAVNYAKKNYSIEAAVRMTVSTTVNKLSNEMSLQNADDMEQDLMELTAHAGARPSHAEWQGQIVSLSAKSGYLSLKDIEYGDAGGFMGTHCRHNWYPYFEGVSQRAWTDEELKNIDPEPFEYQGREYNYYEATQRQRALERSIRNAKKKINMLKEAKDTEMVTIESIKLQRYNKEYRDFSKVANIKTKDDRKYVFK